MILLMVVMDIIFAGLLVIVQFFYF